MPIDSRIALGFQAPQFNDPLNAMAKMYALKNAQQTGEVNALALQNAKQVDVDKEALRAYYKSGQFDKNPRGALVFGTPGAEAVKAHVETSKAQATIDKSQSEVLNQRLEQHLKALDYAVTPSQYIGWVQSAQTDPALKDWFASKGIDPAKSMQYAMAAVQTPEGFMKAREQSALGIKGFIEANKPQVVTQNLGGISRVSAVNPRSGEFNVLDETLNTESPNRPQTNIVNPMETAFEKALGKGQADTVVKNHETAREGIATLSTIDQGRALLDKGAITGFGADFIVGFDQALKQIGVDLGGDASTNTQTYVSLMGQNVGRIIQQFGSGTAISDADRAYAEKIAGGNIQLNEKSLREILDFTEYATRKYVNDYNESIKGVKSVIPLTVNLPARKTKVARPDSIPKTVAPSAKKDTPNTQATAPKVPEGVEPELWGVMTPEEQALWNN